MVNVTSTPSGDMVTYYMVDGQETELIYNLGNMAWIIVSTALVFIMIPGLGFFYAGLLRKKSALSMIWMSIFACPATSKKMCAQPMARLSLASMPSTARTICASIFNRS